MVDMNIYTQNLLVCNTVHYIYDMDLRNFLFVIQDLKQEYKNHMAQLSFQSL